MIAIDIGNEKAITLLEQFQEENVAATTSLICAVFFKRPFKRFLKYKQMVNLGGKTALFMAIDSGNLEAVKELIPLEADVRCAPLKNRTALIHAADHCFTEAARLLLFQRGQADQQGDTALIYAIFRQNRDLINLLRDHEEENVTWAATSLITFC